MSSSAQPTAVKRTGAVIKFELLADKVEARFRELGSDSPEMRRSVDAFARVVRTRIQLGFRMSKAPSGAAWKPLNAFFRTGTPLRNTGRLYGSVKSVRVGEAVLIGTNLKTPDGQHNLGRIHQFGAVIEPREGPGQTYRGRLLGPIPTANKGFVFLKRAVIPARPFMPLNRAGAVQLPPAWAKASLQAMARALDLT